MSDDDDGVYRFECEACGETRTVEDHACLVPTYDLVFVNYGEQMEVRQDGYGDWVHVDELPAIRARARKAATA